MKNPRSSQSESKITCINTKVSVIVYSLHCFNEKDLSEKMQMYLSVKFESLFYFHMIIPIHGC